MLVVDASAIVELLRNTPLGSHIAAAIRRDGGTLHAPHLIDLEIAQVMRRYVRLREISAARAEQVFDDLSRLRIHRRDHAPLLPRIWQLRDTLTAYDAAHVALAEGLDAKLITCDAKLAAAPAHRAQIELFAP